MIKLSYSKKTQALIDKLCRIAERQDFKLNKEKSQELILKTYDLFDLKRPSKVVWHNDVDEICASSAYRAFRAFSASSASSAYSASRAFRASDIDFDWSVLVFEYIQNPEGNKPTKDDYNYLKYSELLIGAKELGVGYFCDWDDTLHLVPCPIITCDDRQRYHSVEKSAIYWKGGEEIYYIHGVNFEKKLWQEVVSGKMPVEKILSIENTEQRRVAYEIMDKSRMKELKDYKVLDEVKDDGYGYPMKVVEFKVRQFDESLRYLNCHCSTTGREYFIETRQTKCEIAKAKSFGFDSIIFSKEL